MGSSWSDLVRRWASRSERLGRASGKHRLQKPKRTTAFVLALLAVGLILGGQTVRTGEAAIQASALNLFGMDANAFGQAVIFPMGQRWVGVGFSMGCSVAPLTALFLGGSAVAAWVRPLRLRSVALGVGALVLVFVIANQLRIATIVGMMHAMGFERGYEFSHIFLGSAISTIGFVAAVYLFVKLVLREPTANVRVLT
ncbi:MAG: exosortase/archaeosortase family protein [Knoellia sp.]